MNLTCLTAALVLAVGSASLQAQTVTLPWLVIDRGGGTSSAGSFALESSIGQPLFESTEATGVTLDGGYIPGLLEFGSTGATVDFAAEANWNMVSVPVIVSDFLKTSLYPTATSAAYAYAGNYQERDTLRNLVGYWVKFPTSKALQFTGTPLSSETLEVNNGWNMVGALSSPFPAADVAPLPPATIASAFFGYSGSSGYFTADTLEPSRAYWIKVDSTGKLVMGSGSLTISPSPVTASAAARRRDEQPVDSMSSLSVQDALGEERTLWFSSAAASSDGASYELPPLPPEGMFDVRFATNRSAASASREAPGEFRIRISSGTYPLTVKWRSHDEATLLVNGAKIPLRGSGEAQLSAPEPDIRLRLSQDPRPAVPAVFALEQNYPNPFNPSTTIRYQLPVESRVTLNVYDLLGREVATLVDERQPAGFKSVAWQPSGLAGGVYFYRLQASDFVQTRKLIVLK